MTQRVERVQDGKGGLLRVETTLSPGVGADRDTVPADGSAGALCHYYTEDPAETVAEWRVTGAGLASESRPIVGGESTLTVLANAAGVVVVTCNGHTLKLSAE